MASTKKSTEEVDAKVAALVAELSSGCDLSEEELKGVEVRARELISKEENLPLEGMEDMRALSLSIGMPLPRGLLQEAIRKAPKVTMAQKKAWMQKAEKMGDIVDLGAIKVEKPDEKKAAYLLLRVAPPDHNLTAQLNKLYAFSGKEKKAELLVHLEKLVALGKSAYEQMRVSEKDLLAEIEGAYAAAEQPFTFSEIALDPGNTTFYLNSLKETSGRVGIFVDIK